MRMLLLRDLTEASKQSRVSKGEYGVRVGRSRGAVGSDGLFDGRVVRRWKGHSFLWYRKG